MIKDYITMTTLFLGIKQQFINYLDIYIRYIHKNLVPIYIHVQERPIYTSPMGFCPKHKASEVDLRSKNENLQNDSEISKSFCRSAYLDLRSTSSASCFEQNPKGNV